VQAVTVDGTAIQLGLYLYMKSKMLIDQEDGCFFPSFLFDLSLGLLDIQVR